MIPRVSDAYFSAEDDRDVPEWQVSRGFVDYAGAVAAMEARVERIAAGTGRELVWLVEHPSIYTAGTSAREQDLLEPERFPVFRTGRGGQFTYHGPGQRVVYVLLDLKRRNPDVRAYVAALEDWIIRALKTFNVDGERRADRIGVWVRRTDKGADVEDKIAAVGVRLRHWVSFHGISLNVEPDLDHYAGIVPCGIQGPGVTSLVDLGRPVGFDEVDEALLGAFQEVFGPVEQSSTSRAL